MMNAAGIEHCRLILVIWGLCCAALTPARLCVGDACPGPGRRTTISHCHRAAIVREGERLPPPCQEKTAFEEQVQRRGARNKTGRILALFIEALSGTAVCCLAAPCQVPHRGKRDLEKENGVAGRVKEACAAASERRCKELQDSSCQAGWSMEVAFLMPGRGSARGQRGGRCGIAWEPGTGRRRRSVKVSGNQTREALQTKRFISEPEIGAEPGDFSEGKGQCSAP